jgi:transcriptional regulator with XRE-family HTH domain
MLFAGGIRRLRDEMQMLQRQFAAVLEIDAPLFSKIERGKRRRAKHEQVIAIVEIFKVNRNDFLNHWLADRIIEVIEDEKNVRESVECYTK